LLPALPVTFSVYDKIVNRILSEKMQNVNPTWNRTAHVMVEREQLALPGAPASFGTSA
jgi:hypothetical protein